MTTPSTAGRATVARRAILVPALGMLAYVLLAAGTAQARERVTLRNGFDLVCEHREVLGDRVRLYTAPENFVEVGAAEIERIEWMPLPLAATAPITPPNTQPTSEELHEMIAKAGREHNLDVALLASVVHAESGGNARAVSRAGARGLMQLMPGTANELGVNDSFEAQQNINGGTAYLDRLLTRYRDNLALALAAYNAGPAAIERYHGIPPYRETRAYVARVIREFNRLCAVRTLAAKQQSSPAPQDAGPTRAAMQLPALPAAGGEQ